MSGEAGVGVASASAAAADESKTNRVILVTGGSGLVGQAIRVVLEKDEEIKQLHKEDTFVFLSSKDGDLRYV